MFESLSKFGSRGIKIARVHLIRVTKHIVFFYPEITEYLFSLMPVVFFTKEIILIWYIILPELRQPSAQLSKLLRSITIRMIQHTMSRWHWTVHIPWLVTSYDTHKAKHLGILLPKPQGNTIRFFHLGLCFCIYTITVYRIRLALIITHQPLL